MLEVGKRSGRSKVAIHMYETGQRPIHFGTFIKLCAAIRVSPSYVIDRWMEKDSFDVLDEQRRKEYHEVIDEMIKYGFSQDLDRLLVYFRGLIAREKEIRDRIRQRERIQKQYHALRDMRREDQGEEDV